MLPISFKTAGPIGPILFLLEPGGHGVVLGQKELLFHPNLREEK
jgi:hypothetical protein